LFNCVIEYSIHEHGGVDDGVGVGVGDTPAAAGELDGVTEGVTELLGVTLAVLDGVKDGVTEGVGVLDGVTLAVLDGVTWCSRWCNTSGSRWCNRTTWSYRRCS